MSTIYLSLKIIVPNLRSEDINELTAATFEFHEHLEELWTHHLLHIGCLFGVSYQIYSLNEGVWTYGEPVKKFRDQKI